MNLEAELPAILTRIRRVLIKDGLDPDSADDVVQDVCVRLLRAEPPPDVPAWNLEKWCFRVALNLRTDLWRRNRRIQSGGELPDRPAPVDVERVVQYRIAEEEFIRALPSLTGKEYEAVVGTVTRLDTDLDTASGAERTRLLSARQRLLERLRNYPVVVPLAGVGRWFSSGEASRPMWAAVTASVVVPLVTTLVLLQHPNPTAGPSSQAIAAEALPAAPAAGRQATNALVAPVAAPESSAAHGDGATGSWARDPSRQTIISIDQPIGNSSGAAFEPNSPAEPMLCFAASGLGACIDKPTITLPPRSPLSSGRGER